MPDHAAFRFVPFAVESCGHMGKEAVKFVNRLGHIAAESSRIPKGAFVRWAVQQLLVTVQRGKAEMYRRSGLIISREQGLLCQCRCHDGTWIWGVVGGCVSCAVRLCVCENSDGRLITLVSKECVMIHSSTLWLLPLTVL